MDLIRDLAVQGLQMVLVLVLAPLLLGFTRKVKARLLRRRGPPVLQPYRDLLRLIRKEVVIADNASWLFRSGPYMIFAATWVAAALVPTFATGLLFSWTADLIAITALLGSARFFLALVGMDIGTSFGGIGSSREMMFASLAEPAMIMIVFTRGAGGRLHPALGDRQLHARRTPACASRSGWRWSRSSSSRIAENARIPVDNPATHLELTMVHEAMVLEYSGRHLAMIELAAAVKLLLYVSLIACIFCPWGLAPADSGLCGLRHRRRDLSRPSCSSAASCWCCSRPRSPRCACSACRISWASRSMLGLLGTLLLLRVAELLMNGACLSTSRTCWPAAWCW